MPKAQTENLMDKIVSLSKRRGFIFPGSEIYGGLANSWDYGPLGTELKNNIKQEWWRMFVHSRDDMVGIDAALIMSTKVWEASGHLACFTDPLVECKKCQKRFRGDQVGSIDLTQFPCTSGQHEFSSPQQFNLMLKTHLGPAEGKASEVYFRPETAQAMFVDFKQVLETSRKKLPFGIAQQGKAFRNEITPGNFIFRTREFEQMEIEYFIRPEEWQKWFEHWLGEMKKWLAHLGVAAEHLHYVEIPAGERAHYSQRTVDIEYDYPFGQKELYGLAYRGDYDLQNHIKASGADLSYPNPADPKEKTVPHVIEPTWGVDRSVLVAMLEAYKEEPASAEAPAGKGEGDKKPDSAPADAKAVANQKASPGKRVYMKFPHWLAPYKVAVFPLLANKPQLVEKARVIYDDLRKDFMVAWDDRGNVGKRYYAQDEIGTPYCVTVDFDSLEDGAVTVRDRDTTKQERVKIAELKTVLTGRLK